MLKNARIYVAGHQGLVGSAIVRALHARGIERVITRTRAQCNLENQSAVLRLFLEEKPEVVFMAAAKVGGILANASFPVDFIRSNLMVQNNLVEAAHACGVRKVVFLGSSCIYPRVCPQPIREDYLLSGPLEPTNEWYAIAKIAGIKLCQAYRRQHGLDAICLMPTNLYGPNDNFSLNDGHVLPALLRRFHEARERGRPEVVLWGTGEPRREFLHVDDLAEACLHLAEHWSGEDIVNVGTGKDLPIIELAKLIAQVVDYKGTIGLDPSKPDGTPRKLLDVSRVHSLGWSHRIGLREGIESTYAWYLANRSTCRS